MRLPFLAIVLLSACSGRAELGDIVDRHCQQSEATLRLGIDRYHAGEDHVIGLGDLRDGDTAVGLFRDFGFCAQSRSGEPAQLTRMSVDFQMATQEMAEARDDRQARERAMKKMADLFAEL